MTVCCLSCDAVNADGNRFCESCGSALPDACPSCGKALAPTARFCGGCGARRGAEPVQDRGAANRGELKQASFPAQERGATSWGELKQASVLFADIASSTEHIAGLDPEEAMERLGPAVQRMCAAIEGFGGTIIRTLGDGVMAVFGIPRALENHAVLACEAALSMQSAFQDDQLQFTIRVGIHSGQVASDPSSFDSTRGGGAHGAAIHLASRVVAVAEPGEICITEQCHALLRGAAEARDKGRRLLKGFAHPVQILVLQRILGPRSGPLFHTTALSPFRGRGAELASLLEALQEAERSKSPVVGVCGAAGTGKSRLCHEFAEICRARGLPVFSLRAQVHAHATPMQSALELLRNYLFGIAPACDPAAARQLVNKRMAELKVANVANEALLNEFLGISAPGAEPVDMLPHARRTRLLDALRMLVRKSAAVPAVLVLEDVHWLDTASEEVVQMLAEALAATRTLLVLNFRPMLRASWQAVPGYRQVDLAELSQHDTEELVRTLISTRPEFQNICELIARRSAGNPFFAEELVRSIAEYGMPPRQAKGPASEAVEQTLPATVQAVIGERIDRLPEDQKTLLQMCSVVGKEVPLAILQHVSGLPISRIGKLLESLCQHEFLQPPADDTDRFAFRHPLIQEVAYSMQLRSRRASLHAVVAEAMEARYADQIGEFAGLISYHHEAAGQFLLAARFMATAARWLGTSHVVPAVSHWHKVRSLIEGQSRSQEVDKLRMLANSQIALQGWREGLMLHEVQPFIDEAKELAQEVDHRVTQLLLMAEGRLLQASGGAADQYVKRIEEALALVAPDDLGRKAMLNAALSQAYGRAGLVVQALSANDAAWSGIGHIDRFDREFIGLSTDAWVLALRGRSLARCGRHEEAQEAWQQALRRDGSWLDPTVEVIPCLGRIELAWCNRDSQLADEQAARAHELAVQYKMPYLDVVAGLCRGMAAAIARRDDEALPELIRVLDLIRESKVAIEFEVEVLLTIAECYLSKGEINAARRYIAEATELARRRCARLSECRALISAALLALEEGAFDSMQTAAGLLEQARALVDTTGASIYDAPLQRALSRLEGQRVSVGSGQ